MRNYPFGDSVRFVAIGFLSTFFYSLRDGFFIHWLRGVRDGVAGMKEYYKDRKIISSETLKLLKEIDRERPSLFYMAKKRVFKKSMRL